MNSRGQFGRALEFIARDPDHFCQFVDREAELLIRAGVSQDVVAWLIERIQARVAQYIHDPATSAELAEDIDLLREQVCHHRDLFLNRLSQQAVLDIVILCFSGLSLFAINVSAAAALSPIGVGASCGIGGGLIKDAAQDLLGRL